VHNVNEMPARLAAFLAKVEPGWRNVTVDSYEVMTGGYSRLLARAEITHAGGRETLVLRGDPPKDRQLIETSRRQEYELLRVVADHGVRTPRALHFDDSGEHLGSSTIILPRRSRRTRVFRSTNCPPAWNVPQAGMRT